MAVIKRRAEDAPLAGDNVVETATPRRLSVSEILYTRRLECGLDIEHVAEILRIRPPVLEAIESGQFDQLPGAAYAIGFVRSYATYLGLDTEAVVLRFKAEAAEVSRKPHLHFPLPVSESRIPTGPLMLIGILLAVLGYGAWYYFSVEHGRFSDIVPSVPDRLSHLGDVGRAKQDLLSNTDRVSEPAKISAPPVPSQVVPVLPPAVAAVSAPVNQPIQAPPSTIPAPVQPKPVASLPVPVGIDTAASPSGEVDGVPPVEARPASPTTASVPVVPDLAQPTVDDAGKAASPAAIYGAPAGETRVVLRAVTESWIQVRDRDGSLLITRVLKPGESYNVPNQMGLTMVTGNAGGIEIVVDGTTVSRIGDVGRVARNVSLDPDRLLATRPHAN